MPEFAGSLWVTLVCFNKPFLWCMVPATERTQKELFRQKKLGTLCQNKVELFSLEPEGLSDMPSPLFYVSSLSCCSDISLRSVGKVCAGYCNLYEWHHPYGLSSVRSVFHHFHIISSHPHCFRAQQTVGQQRPLKPRQGTTLSAVQSWRWKSACNSYSKFFDLSAPSRAFSSGEKTRFTVTTFRLENWTTEERGLWVDLLCLSYNSHYCNYTADVSLKGRKCKILI